MWAILSIYGNNKTQNLIGTLLHFSSGLLVTMDVCLLQLHFPFHYTLVAC